MSISPIHVGGRAVGRGLPVFVIAEAGVNHNGDIERARGLIQAAAAAGADAVKFQTFRSEFVVSPTAPRAAYQSRNLGAEGTQLEMLRGLELSAEMHRLLIADAATQGIRFLSSPFDEQSVDLLDELSVPAFKVASGEITNWPLLRHVARKGRPIILSTGMSCLEEVDAAVEVLRGSGCRELALMHCVSDYPANPADANLRAIATLESRFHIPIGYSDHTPGIAVALAAIAMGACVIEKHFTLDRTLPGPDHLASLEPAELRALVEGVRTVEAALGDGSKVACARELDTRRVARRSLAASCELAPGAEIRLSMLISLRPEGGIPPDAIDQVVGRRLVRRVRSGEFLAWSDFE